jgi:hypothetical protein
MIFNLSISSNDLHQVRRIKYSGDLCQLARGPCYLCAQCFTETSQLSSVEISHYNIGTAVQEFVETGNELLLALFESWIDELDPCLHKDVFRFTRKRASRGQAAELVLKFPVDFKTDQGVMTISGIP